MDNRLTLERIWSMGISSGFLSIKGGINLWQSLVRSILDYGSQLWGNEVWKQGESLQLEMGKRLLRCSMTTGEEIWDGGLCKLEGIFKN